jgi:hypothetical protein
MYGPAGRAADIDTQIQYKEAEYSQIKARADKVRADIQKDHPGDTRPVEDIIVSDIAFETHFDGKLQNASEKLDWLEKAGGGRKLLIKLKLDDINKKISPFFKMDISGNLYFGPALLSIPGQFPAMGALPFESARPILEKTIAGNNAMLQKRKTQLAVLGEEKSILAELEQLKLQKQRRKIVGFRVECSPKEIFPDQTALCMAWVEFEDGSKTQYNVRSVWNGAHSGIVRGSEYPAGAPVKVEASYHASADEGGKQWRAADHVKIFSKQPIPGIVPPPPKPQPVGQTRPPISGPGGGTRHESEAGENGSDTDFGQESPPTEVPSLPPFSAELDCPSSFELVCGEFIGRGCGIVVKGWDPKGGRVEVKVNYPKKSGIEIFPGNTSADASQMHTPGVTDYHDRYVFSQSIRAKETAPEGITTVTFTVIQQGRGSVTFRVQVSVLKKGQTPAASGIRPPVDMATGGGPDAKWCVWRYRHLYEPPECFMFAKAECFKYNNRRGYELVGQQMTWMQAEALMNRLSRYGGDAYGCLAALNRTSSAPDTDGTKNDTETRGEKDSDGDGTPDDKDGCPTDPDKTAPGVCGCGKSDKDTDNDGVPDCHDDCPNDPEKTDPGQCGCGEPETDIDGDGTPDCMDGCPDDPEKTKPGACGCGTPDTDENQNGIADCNESRQVECLDNGDCPAGYVCVNKECVVPFDSDYDDYTDTLTQRDDDRSQDRADQVAADQASAGHTDGYDSDDIDRDMASAGQAVAGKCRKDSQCPPGYVCLHGECVEHQSCYQDADCPVGYACQNGHCVKKPECLTEADCPAGYACLDGRCVRSGCTSDNDCPKGQVCESGVCVDKAVSSPAKPPAPAPTLPPAQPPTPPVAPPKDRNLEWHASQVCAENEGPEYRWRWLIRLKQSGTSVDGYIYFHKCPGGGRAAYQLSGQENANGSFSVTGQKAAGRGGLGASAPQKTTFTLTEGRPPSPLY